MYRIFKQQNGKKEFYLRSSSGRELGIYTVHENGRDSLRTVNLYGAGLIGRIDVRYVPYTYTDPETHDTMTNIRRNDERYYYINDHLGSVRAIVDSSGTTVFAQDTYPYGDIYRTYTLGGYGDQKYDFTGKERDIETGLHYYGARYYDSDLGRWLQVDPLADASPGWSTYKAFNCNPLRYTDPTGMLEDDYSLDENGEIKLLRKTDDETDKLISVDQDGKEKENNITVAKGILDKMKTEVDSKGRSITTMKVKGDENATKLFEFIAVNSKVEWTQIKYGKDRNYLSSGHEESSEPGAPFVMTKLLQGGYFVREQIHSHPGSSGPSGFAGDKGDKQNAEQVLKFAPQVQFKVFRVGTNSYTGYNAKEVLTK